MVASHHVGVGKQTQFLLKSSSVASHLSIPSWWMYVNLQESNGKVIETRSRQVEVTEAANMGHNWNLIPWGCWHWCTLLGMIPLMGDGVCTDVPVPITLAGS